MARHADRRTMFTDRSDREDFITCLANLARQRRLVVYAWALMPNHCHLLVGTARGGLEPAMGAFFAGFGRRIRRAGA